MIFITILLSSFHLFSQDKIDLEFLEILNQHRKELQLPQLVYDDKISKVMTEHVHLMAERYRRLGHTDFASRCTQIQEHFKVDGWCGENVAAGQENAEQVFWAWYYSRGHRKIMESPWPTHIGIVKEKNEFDRIFWGIFLFQKEE